MLLSSRSLHALTTFSLQICISWIFHIIAILSHVAFDFWLFSSVKIQLCGSKCLIFLFVYVILGFRDSPGLSGTCYVARMPRTPEFPGSAFCVLDYRCAPPRLALPSSTAV